MTIVIPAWLLWTLGCFLGLMLALAIGAGLALWLLSRAQNDGIARGLHW